MTISLAILGVVASCADRKLGGARRGASDSTGVARPVPVFPGEAWVRRSPAEVGTDSALLDDALSYLKTKSGRDGLDETVGHDIYSCTKALTSTCWALVGGRGGHRMPDAPADAAYMSGFNHNVCYVVPSAGLVVVRMGENGNPPEGKHVVWNEFARRLRLGHGG